MTTAPLLAAIAARLTQLEAERAAANRLGQWTIVQAIERAVKELRAIADDDAGTRRICSWSEQKGMR